MGGSGSLRQHFLDMGLIPGKTIRFIKEAPMGDPVEYRIWGYELTLRKEDAEKILIEKIDEDKEEAGGTFPQQAYRASRASGKWGKYHVKQSGVGSGRR